MLQGEPDQGLQEAERQAAEVAPALLRVSAALRVEALPCLRAMAPAAKAQLLVRATPRLLHAASCRPRRTRPCMQLPPAAELWCAVEGGTTSHSQ